MVLAVPAGMIAILSDGIRQAEPNATILLRDTSVDPGTTVDWTDFQVSSNTGANAATLRANVIDPTRKAQTATIVEVMAGYRTFLAPAFIGRLLSARRSIHKATDGDLCSIDAVGVGVELLDKEVTTPRWDQSYFGVGNWNQANVQTNGGWRRSEIVDDLMRTHLPTVARDITATTRIVRQNPFVKTKLADVVAQIALFDLAKARFAADGRFVFRPAP